MPLRVIPAARLLTLIPAFLAAGTVEAAAATARPNIIFL
ncbi:MAG: hypothetical protein RLZZ188_3062, partial [Verrucomicrobiota bacterium]